MLSILAGEGSDQPVDDRWPQGSPTEAGPEKDQNVGTLVLCWAVVILNEQLRSPKSVQNYIGQMSEDSQLVTKQHSVVCSSLRRG